MTSRPTMTALAVVLLAGGGASPVMAGGMQADTALFDKIDSDSDDVITLDELRADSKDWFLTVDLDEDGEISKDEMLSGSKDSGLLGTKARMVYNELDLDQDGQISRDEFAHSVGIVHAATDVDLDRDDYVSADEASADFDRTFVIMDRDEDGVLTEDEWELDLAMAEVDADGSGDVTRTEFMTYGEEAYDELAESVGESRVTTADYKESVSQRDDPTELMDVDEG